MKYYNYEQYTQMKKKAWNWKLYAVLDAYFDEESDDYGIKVLFDEKGNAELFEVCKLSNVTQNGATWTHYANIQLADDGTWEVNEQFKGKNEDEMWVYAYYKRFADACKCIATGKFKKMKPIKIY